MLLVGGSERILESHNTQWPVNGSPQGAGTPSSSAIDKKNKYIIAYDDNDECAGFSIPFKR